MKSMKWKAPARVGIILTSAMVLFAALGFIAHANSKPAAGDEKTAKLVSEMISRYHISRKTIDDEVSQRLLDRFLEQLDPQKLYFIQADIDGFEKLKTELDDQIKAGDVQFAFTAFDVYDQRLSERMKLVKDLIDRDYDYTIDEEMVTDADELDWAKSEEEINERWRKRIKYDLLTLKLDGTKIDEARERLHKRYHNIQSMMEQTEGFEKLEMYLSSLTHCFDPHSSYMSPETLDDFQIQMRLRLEGIGAALRSEDGYTTVAQIVPGGAAEKDGRLKVGDKIIGVAQEDGEFTDIVEMKLSRVVRLIRGNKGTVVRLQVKPKTAPTEIKTYELTRQEIELKSSEVKGEIIDLSDRLGDGKGKIGVINIPSFYRDFDGARSGVANFKSTSRDVHKVLQDFEKQGGVDAVLIDLRMNGGGALSEAIEVTGLFINNGPVVMVKEQDGNIKSHNDVDEGVAYTGPLVVVCNRLSASASEIFAGAIKDYGRGIVVGDTTTHGKGTVQNVMPVARSTFRFLSPPEQRGALKLTINQFYRVNGASTQNKGVTSDIVLPSLIDHMDLGESFLDNALKFDQVDEVDHDRYGMRRNEVISALQQASAQRLTKNEEFQKVNERIAKYMKRKNRKTVSLNEETLKAEQESEQKEAKEEEEAEEAAENNTEGPIMPEGYYNDELLQIAQDYVDLLERTRTVNR